MPLVAALVSASVSLLVFLLGQWLLYRANQTAFLRTKLEEYMTSLEVIIERCAWPDFSPDDSTAIQIAFTKAAGALARSLERPRMFAHMYFPESVHRFNKLATLIGRMNTWMHDYGDPRLPYDYEKGPEIFGEIMPAMMDLRDYLRDEQGYLTRRILHRL